MEHGSEGGRIDDRSSSLTSKCVKFAEEENIPHSGKPISSLSLFFFKGILVCIFFVFLSAEFRRSLRRKWMQWRYGIVEETVRPGNPSVLTRIANLVSSKEVWLKGS